MALLGSPIGSLEAMGIPWGTTVAVGWGKLSRLKPSSTKKGGFLSHGAIIHLSDFFFRIFGFSMKQTSTNHPASLGVPPFMEASIFTKQLLSNWDDLRRFLKQLLSKWGGSSTVFRVVGGVGSG